MDAVRSTRREGDDEDDAVRRQAGGDADGVHPLSVGLDVLAPETGARLLGLRFEWSSVHGVTARVDHGPADVLIQAREAGEAGEEGEEGAEDGVSDTAAATPPWLIQLAADGRPDTALAASVVETLRQRAMS